MKIIQQALHGYRDGHKLLRASIRISTDVSQQLLVASDATGPAARNGFASYLSGFPISSEQLYVLARTWFAPEMPRPGCVWTHSLLVPFALLDELEDLDSLLSAHRRPTGALLGYEDAVELPLNTFLPHVDEEDERLLRAIVAALYSGQDKAVVVAMRESERIEPQIVRLWSQQWPALRKEFSFCTGQLAERPVANRADLQIIPQERRFRWRDAGVKLLDEAQPFVEDSEYFAAWVDRAIRLLRQPMIQFVNDPIFNAAPAERRLFPVLMELRDHSDEMWSHSKDVLDKVAVMFPQPKEAAEFKRLLLAERSPLWIDQNLASFVEWVGTDPAAAAYDDIALRIDDRLRMMWSNDQKSATQLLRQWSRVEPRPILSRLVAAATADTTWLGLIELATQEPGLLSAIATEYPAVLTEPAVWSNGTHLRREAIELLLNGGSRIESQIPHVIVAMTQARAFDALGEIVRRSEQSVVTAAVPALVRTIQTHSGWEAHSLLNAMHSREGVVMEWLRANRDPDIVTSQVLALLFVPSRQNADRLGAECLGRFVRSSIERTHISSDALRYVPGVFSLMCAFSHDQASVVHAGVGAFGVVHQAASTRQLDDCSLQWLYSGLPRLEYWKEWDLCEKLRTAAAQKLIAHQWEAHLLFVLLSPGSDFDRLLRTTSHQKGGKKFLRGFDSPHWRHTVSEEHIRQLRDWI